MILVLNFLKYFLLFCYFFIENRAKNFKKIFYNTDIMVSRVVIINLEFKEEINFKGGKMLNENIRQKIISVFREKKEEIFKLSDLYDLPEDDVKKELFNLLEELNLHEPKKYSGLFGWNEFRPDRYINIDKHLLIVEVKRVIKHREDYYWHAPIQGMIYSFLEKKENDNFSVLCIILDWGRKAGKKLDDDERKFIEHNLDGEWKSI